MFVDDLRAVVEANGDGVRISGLDDLVEIRRLLDRVEGAWAAEVVVPAGAGLPRALGSSA